MFHSISESLTNIYGMTTRLCSLPSELLSLILFLYLGYIIHQMSQHYKIEEQ